MNDIFTATLWIRCCENTHVHTHTALTCRPGRFRNGQMSVFSSLFALFLSCALVRMWRVGSAQREGTRVQRCVGIIRCSEHIYSHTEGRLPQWEHRLCLHSSCPASPRISHPSYLHTLPLRYSHTLNKPTCTNCFIIQMYNWLFYIYNTETSCAVKSEMKEWRERKESEARRWICGGSAVSRRIPTKFYNLIYGLRSALDPLRVRFNKFNKSAFLYESYCTN